jgi:phosphoadenosine phosphosulfate reductase
MSELGEKVKKSIERLKLFEPEDGYYLAFSGGKDSVTCKALMDMAGVKYDATYRVTSVDPPELVRFIKEKHPDVAREVPRDKNGKPVTMWNLIPKKSYPPTRVARYCCASLKESGGDGRLVVTGVRWAESSNRKKNQGMVTVMGRKAANEILSDDFRRTDRGGIVLTNDNEQSRRMIEQCYKRHKTTVNPIIEWTDADVWDFIHANTIPYC